MTVDTNEFYISTPIYYVNDRPHLGHIYTTTVADIAARYHRMLGDDVFFLTGTDEHAQKVVDAASARNLTPQQWADKNAEEFQNAFAHLNITNDDFIRTTQKRHTEKVGQYVKQLLESGDVYEGEYEGWYDTGQEEYITENKARENDYKSEINGKPLVKRKETNYFFKLSAYADKLIKILEDGSDFDVQPEARKNEVIARIKEGLNDVPISRNNEGDTSSAWGIKVPGDKAHSIYVWIDALLNYLTTVDTDEREKYWPADVHLIAKDILWFHAVIWPALLIALKKPLPKLVYAHSFWISEGQKMSKSLGNFVDLEKIDDYINDFSLDALRYYLTSQGPLGTTDSDLAEARFIEVYNADLANTLGNSASRVANMIEKYFDGKVPPYDKSIKKSLNDLTDGHGGLKNVALEAEKPRYLIPALPGQWLVETALNLIRGVDSYIDNTQPFKMTKDPDNLPKVGNILYDCAEALRIASILLWPVMPQKMEDLWHRIGCKSYADELINNGKGDFANWVKWGQLKPSIKIEKGNPLFPRFKQK